MDLQADLCLFVHICYKSDMCVCLSVLWFCTVIPKDAVRIASHVDLCQHCLPRPVCQKFMACFGSFSNFLESFTNGADKVCTQR